MLIQEYLTEQVKLECTKLQDKLNNCLEYGWKNCDPSKLDKTPNSVEAFFEYLKLQATMEMLIDTGALGNCDIKGIDYIKDQKKFILQQSIKDICA